MAYVGPAQGNATKAARLAGYKHPNVQASGLVKLSAVKAAIQEFVAAEKVKTVMDRRERQEMLSLMGRGSFEFDERIRSIDVLNKMDGIYIQKHEISARVMNAPLGEIAEQTAEALRELGATVIPPKGGWPEEKPNG